MDFQHLQEKFDEKFHRIIHRKTNRQKVFSLLKQYVMENYKTFQAQQDMMYFLFYELHVEWTVYPKVEDFFSIIRHKRFAYDHPNFEKVKRVVKEEEDYIMNPPVISEGVIQCKKCKSKRTFSFDKQTRSSDEAVTIFVRCVDCGCQFRM